MAVDWAALEQEYITTDISYREMAKKYGVHKTTIANQGARGQWQCKREQHRDKTRTAVLDAVLEADTREKIDRATRIRDVADKLLTGAEDLIGQGRLSAKDIKSLAGALKDMTEIHRTFREEENSQNQVVTVVFAEGEESWNE